MLRNELEMFEKFYKRVEPKETNSFQPANFFTPVSQVQEVGSLAIEDKFHAMFFILFSLCENLK